MNPAMRRIPRTQRSIDPTLPLTHISRPRLPSSPCRAAALTSTPLLRTTSASFSTTPHHAFLNLKQDKKKHMAMVRKWQRRIIGDSEPIGSHVDPYDPTSPIRVAPEETGEEQEYIEGMTVYDEAHGEEVEYIPYEEAEDGSNLIKIGTPEYIKARQEEAMEARFEELLARPYPVLDHTFGPEKPITNRKTIAENFHRAVVEAYTLKEAGLDMDVSSYGDRGSYGSVPFSFADVRFSASPSKDLVLAFPTPEAKAKLLEQMQKPAEVVQHEELIMDEAEFLLDGAEAVAEEPHKKEPDAPGSKRAALVKQEGTAFDFMSNRPVPRAKPVEKPARAVVSEQPAKKELDVHSAAEASHKAISELRSTVLEAVAQHHENSVAALREAIRGNIESIASDSIDVIKPPTASVVPASDVKLKQIHISDDSVKFALYKRLVQTTGIRIPDFQLNSTRTLGELLSHLHANSRPKTDKLHPQIAKPTKLGKLPNVRVHAKPVTEIEKETEVGLWKVIEYALTERGLPVYPEKKIKSKQIKNLVG